MVGGGEPRYGGGRGREPRYGGGSLGMGGGEEEGA